jgi:hypothetical protein
MMPTAGWVTKRTFSRSDKSQTRSIQHCPSSGAAGEVAHASERAICEPIASMAILKLEPGQF